LAGTSTLPSDRAVDDGRERESKNALVVLAVERDPHVRDLEAYFLGQAGYAVEFEDDGVAALEHARTTKPRVVITAILLPRLDGLALCRKLKADPATKDIKVLVFSLLAAHARAKEAGADGFLTKPLAEQPLLSAVREILKGTTQ
jgi:CheY-like chemotaxis protein